MCKSGRHPWNARARCSIQRTVESRSMSATSEKRTSLLMEVSAPVVTVDGANLSSLERG